MEFRNNYPCVYLHGLMGFGEEDTVEKHFAYFGFANTTFFQHMEEKGYECYHPNIGPVNSAWDRVCILWAYLFGGRVDYGKVHAEKHGHARYGKYYPGVLKDLGQTEAHKKINLLGHSFGGPTVKMAVTLFAYGSEEERNGTPPEELSPLFAGGHGDLIHSVTTLAGVNNGTALASLFGKVPFSVVNYALMALVTLVGDTPFTKFYDFGASQWGIMPFREDVSGWHFQNPLKHIAAARAFDRNKTFDNINREMQIEVIQEAFNPAMKYPENVYYFAQRAIGTKPGRNGNPIPDRKAMSLLCFIPGQITCRAMLPRLAKYGLRSDPNWRACDGFVNLVGQSAPLDAKYEEADYDTDFKPGIWYNMPLERGDHIFWNGWLQPPEQYDALYTRMMDLYRSLPDGEDV